MEPRTYPPLNGSITLPETIDFHLKHNPQLPIYAFNQDGSDEITEISYLEFGRACDRVAHLLRPQRGEDRPVVAFIALADTIMYQAITIGMMRAGLVVSRASVTVLMLLTLRTSAIPDLPS
jgi:acyl-CoA synthetase (AMP-forming)/AMP-acid ligase II